MSSPSKPLGVLRPLGGGDPIPLTKPELLVGRRPSCDIRLDFENVSGKHCQLSYVQGVWHVRDLGSTNGTTLNGNKLANDHTVMPDDEVGLATHLFTIDYDPAVAPGSLVDPNLFLDESAEEVPRKRSLLELAGLESPTTPPPRPSKAPEKPRRDEPEEVRSFEEIPPDFSPSTPGAPSDDDFFDLIKQDVESEKQDRKGHRG